MECKDQVNGGIRVMELPRWWSTLFLRLAFVVTATVVGVLGAFEWIEYRAARAAHIQAELDTLREEVMILDATRDRLQQRQEYQGFLDEFCQQMSSAASPGHHIAVFDQSGRVIQRAHARVNHGLEVNLAKNLSRKQGRLALGRDQYLFVGERQPSGETIMVAQSMAPVERFLAARRANVLTSTGALVLAIFGLTMVSFIAWVRDPMRRLVRGVAAIGRGELDARVRRTGGAEFRFLADRINEMAEALGKAAKLRQAEMSRARGIQQSLLPKGSVAHDRFDIASRFLPADSVGGDLLDVVELADGSHVLAVFDVTGHGVPAALYTALLRSVLRRSTGTTTDVAEIASNMNSELCEIGNPGEFATCFICRIDKAASMLEYTNAGHDPAILVRPDGNIRDLMEGGLLLGVMDDAEYERHSIPLCQDDRIYLFTDGLHEVFDQNGFMFGRDRLEALLAESRQLPLNKQLDRVIEGVRAFQGCQSFPDDVTILAVSCH